MHSTTVFAILALVITFFVAWSGLSYFFEHSVKTPAYTLIEQRQGYEVRLYEPYLTAQVEASGTHEEALNEGFRILAAYIFGENTAQTDIAMTAPVLEGESEEIEMTAPVTVTPSVKLAMTAPVLEGANGTGRTVSFVMPAEYTLETLPKPNDPRVVIVPQEARRVAALRFSWFRDGARIEQKQDELLALLARDGVAIAGSPEYAGYNAPLTAPWMTRNEILVEIE